MKPLAKKSFNLQGKATLDTKPDVVTMTLVFLCLKNMKNFVKLVAVSLYYANKLSLKGFFMFVLIMVMVFMFYILFLSSTFMLAEKCVIG